ncbi:MAG: Asp-tRNA(Asn)/Glu-tRNA(Gln) amidotransferase subunit GatA [Oscillospiraceae bacterium]
MELYKKSAAELSKMLEKKEISSVELINATYDRVDSQEKDVEAFITLAKDSAIKKAEEIDKMRLNGDNMPILAGVPIGIKDNICTKGLRTTCASKMLGDFVPPYSATVVEKLDKNGVITVGKMNMDEFAMGSSTETSFFHKTKNPWDLSRVPGGSSGGSAAAVASGEVPFSLGSDTGGSIRQPASLCGVVGLKPTYGSVSRYGLVAFASSLDQIGPFARTVLDTALLFDTIKGHDSHDATSSKFQYGDIISSLSNDIKGVKIGLPKEYFGEGVDAEVKAEIMRAAETLKQLGAEITEISLPSTDYALQAYYIIACAEASSNLARFDGVRYGFRAENLENLNDLYEKTRSEGFGEEVKRRIMLGTFVLSSGYYDAYYNRAKLLQKKITAEFEEAYKKCDLLLTPVSPSTAFKIGENINNPLKMYASDICTINVNIAGLPAISLPFGIGEDKMPIGVQLIGPKFSEKLILNVSSKLEEAVGGFNKVAVR